MTEDEKFEAWLQTQPDFLTRDPLWRMAAFRLASHAVDVAWPDVLALARHELTRDVARQLWRALGSIPANITEGYSRSSGRDRVRIYEYALGSARESSSWYRSAAPILGATIAHERQARLQRVVQLLSVAIPAERRRHIDIERPVVPRRRSDVKRTEEDETPAPRGANVSER